jgi:hypothetical protein
MSGVQVHTLEIEAGVHVSEVVVQGRVKPEH